METVQVVLGKALLRAADDAARRYRMNRSALIRDALREHLKRLMVQQRERRDRDGYEAHPPRRGELTAWDKVAEWPDE
jgi:metal-responsive CopG/Arc/MetJ family transcriptional regulator